MKQQEVQKDLDLQESKIYFKKGIDKKLISLGFNEVIYDAWQKYLDKMKIRYFVNKKSQQIKIYPKLGIICLMDKYGNTYYEGNFFTLKDLKE